MSSFPPSRSSLELGHRQRRTPGDVVWLDDKRLPIHTEISMDSAQGPVRVVGDYSDYGVRVAVKPPADSEIIKTPGGSRKPK